MSKSTQRKESAFEDGRSSFRQANKIGFFDGKGFYDPKNYLNPYHKKNGLRSVWNAGWMEESRK